MPAGTLAPDAMRRKLLTATVLIAILVVTARFVERKTRPDLVDIDD